MAGNDGYEENKEKAAIALKEIDPRLPLGTELFNAIARLSVSVAIETVALRTEKGRTQVLLTKRAQDDSAYPGMWHSPGSFLRPGEAIEAVFKRLSGKEFGAEIPISAFVGFFNNTDEERGHVLHLIFIVEVAEPIKGACTWFNVDAMPPNTILFHRRNYGVVAQAISFFENNA